MGKKLFDDKPDFWEYLKKRLEVAWLVIQIYIAITITLKLGFANIVEMIRGLLG